MNTVVTGGGCFDTGDNQSPRVEETYPADGTSWTCKQIAAGTGTLATAGYALCLGATPTTSVSSADM